MTMTQYKMISRKWVVFMLAGMLWLPATFIPIRAQEQAQTGGVTIHVVQRGENLYRIAVRYGLTFDELARLNGLADPSNIQIGQRLLVPVTPGGTLPELHIVQPGETLRAIADLYQLSVTDLAQWNEITDVNSIYAGQQLRITPSEEVEPIPTATPQAIAAVSETSDETAVTDAAEESADVDRFSSVIHVVQRGETLYRIASQYGVTVNAIMRANPIDNPETIFAGQQLVIPGVEAPQLATSLPAPLTRLEVTPLVLVEGQTGRFRIGTNAQANITATFLDRRLNIGAEIENVLGAALVGVPVGTEPGIYPLTMQIGQPDETVTEFVVNVQVVSGQYGRERIRLMEGRDELLEVSSEEAEFALLQRVMDVYNPERYFTGPMGLPAAAAMTSPFGNSRSYNGDEFTRVHTGADFAGIPGTPILAPAAGRVVLADELNIRGVATVIDHGWGVYTGYWHQSERYVSLGEWVEARQVIGGIGSSGRVTGPHLHWELWVNGVPVDPMQWVRISFN
jgi:murein DD-endopeptidase MepM/ murein hydrolase activator NlpD